MVSPAIKVVLCDIEGTTTSISFVKDTLFPYALMNVQSFLNDNWNDPSTQKAVVDLREQSKTDLKSDLKGVTVLLDEDKDKIEQIAAIVENVKWQMANDRKEAPLKNLQGLIWAKGYKDGTIKGHVYPDVPKAFDSWIEHGTKIYIYSSGSVAAQKLIFEHTELGDLLPKLSGHFDTAVGMKQDSNSYLNILKDIGCVASETLFLTDIVLEATAAMKADINVVLLDRPGNAPFTVEHRTEFSVVTSFDDINLDGVKLGKRKLADVTTTEEDRPTKLPKIETDTVANDTIADCDKTDITTDRKTAQNDNGISNKNETVESNNDTQCIDIDSNNKTENNKETGCIVLTEPMNTDDSDSTAIKPTDVANDKENNAHIENGSINKNPTNGLDTSTNTDDIVMTDISTETSPIESNVDIVNSSENISPKNATNKNANANLGENSSSKMENPINGSEEAESNRDKTDSTKITAVETCPAVDVNISVTETDNLVMNISTDKSKQILADKTTKDADLLQNKSTENEKEDNSKVPSEALPKIVEPENGLTDTLETETSHAVEVNSLTKDQKPIENESAVTQNEEKEEKSPVTINSCDIIAPTTESADIIMDVTEVKAKDGKEDSIMPINADQQTAEKVELEKLNENDLSVKDHSPTPISDVAKSTKDEDISDNATVKIAEPDTDIEITTAEKKKIEVVTKNGTEDVPIQVHTEHLVHPENGDTKTTETTKVTEVIESNSDNSSEKVSRVEITIEQVDKQLGQVTQTTTHIVKEMSIVEHKGKDIKMDTAKIDDNIAASPQSKVIDILVDENIKKNADTTVSNGKAALDVKTSNGNGNCENDLEKENDTSIKKVDQNEVLAD